MRALTIVWGVVFLLVATGGADTGQFSVDVFHELPAFHKTMCAEEPDRVTATFCGMEFTRVRLTHSEGETIVLNALLARTSEQRAAGFQHISEDVIAHSAILFAFERETTGAFHMCNVEAPLDILWIRENGSLLDVQRMLPGGTVSVLHCHRIYAPRHPGRYIRALETPVGLLESFGFDPENPWEWTVTID